MTGGSSLKMSNMKIITNDGHSLNFDGAGGSALISNCELGGGDWSLVDAASPPGAMWSTGKAGVYLKGASNVKISNCTFTVSGDCNGVAAASDAVSNSVKVANCGFIKAHATLFAGSRGIYIPARADSEGSGNRWSMSKLSFSGLARDIEIRADPSGGGAYLGTNAYHSILACDFNVVGATAVQGNAYAKIYDADIDTYQNLSAVTGGTFTQWQVLPNAPATDDALYLGAARPWDVLTIDLAVAMAYTDGRAFAWQYWNGSSWATLPITYDQTGNGYDGGTSPLRIDGVVLFATPADWAAVSVGGQSAYWVRLSVTTAGTGNICTFNGANHTATTSANAVFLGSRGNQVIGGSVFGPPSLGIVVDEQANLVQGVSFASGHAHAVLTPTADYSRVENNNFGSTTAWPGTSKSGSLVLGTNCYQCVVLGNRFSAANLIRGGSTAIIGQNDGYVTETSGTAATITAAATTVVVTHGLSYTPTAADITVTPTNSMGSATKFWVDTIGATYFTINVDQVPGATTAIFSWSVRRTGSK
jgi:hypothetical protein